MPLFKRRRSAPYLTGLLEGAVRVVRRESTWFGKPIWVDQLLTQDGRHLWSTVSAAAATHDDAGRVQGAGALRILIRNTVQGSNFGLEQPGSESKITDPDFGWFLYDLLGGPDLMEEVNRASSPDFLPKLRGSPPETPATPSPSSLLPSSLSSGMEFLTPSFDGSADATSGPFTVPPEPRTSPPRTGES